MPPPQLPVKEELDEAVPPHELLDVSASRAKGELASRGGLANRHLPSLKKTTSMSSASSQVSATRSGQVRSGQFHFPDQCH